MPNGLVFIIAWKNSQNQNAIIMCWVFKLLNDIIWLVQNILVQENSVHLLELIL